MGKYDEFIGGGHIIIDINEVLDEQINMINERRKLAEKLISLTEDDIASNSDDPEYLANFINVLKDYLNRL